jgi:hypothetical protein
MQSAVRPFGLFVAFVVSALALSSCCLQGLCYAAGCCELGTTPAAVAPPQPITEPPSPLRLSRAGQPQAF